MRAGTAGTAGAAALLLLLAACGSGSNRGSPRPTPSTTSATSATITTPTAGAFDPSAPCGWRTTPPPRYDHVVWIWMENHSHGQVIGDRAAPYETALAKACGTATAYAQVGSPSLPNYIGATSGGTQGISDDAGPGTHRLTVDNLFRQVRASGRAERSYVEAMPANCAVDSSGTYAVKHNPAAYFQGESDRAACLTNDVAFTALAADLERDTLPAFSSITPDLCHDTHDCSVGVGDQWLQQWLPRILTSRAYTSGSTAVFVVWDESTPMPNIVISPTTPPGTVLESRVDHYSLLRTTEELLGLTTLLGRAAGVASLRPPFSL